MRKYLSTLHQKPDHHKKRFALLASSTVTLFIFGFWALATFGINEQGVLARLTSPDTSSDTAEVETRTTQEVTPLESARLSLGSSIEAFKSVFGELKSRFKLLDLEEGYLDLRDGALDTYGQGQ